MTRRKLWAVSLAATLVVSAGAVALGQADGSELEAGKKWLLAMNHKGDTDKTISHAEFNRYMDEQFKLADADHDGTLDAAELGHLHSMLLGK